MIKNSPKKRKLRMLTSSILKILLNNAIPDCITLVKNFITGDFTFRAKLPKYQLLDNLIEFRGFKFGGNFEPRLIGNNSIRPS